MNQKLMIHPDKPISSIQFEYSVVGGILLDPDAIEKVDLDSEDFFDGACREAFEIMRRFTLDNTPIDVITVAEAAKPNGMINESGGLAFLGGICNNTPGSANIKFYATHVREASVSRKLAAIGGEFDSVARRIGVSAEEKLIEADSLLTKLSESRQRSSDPMLIKDALVPYCDTLALRESGGAQGYKTGLDELDEVLGGLMPEDLIVVGARPSMGKTALVTGWAERIASAKTKGLNGEEFDQPALICSMEMKRDQIIDRTISAVASIDSRALTRGNLTESDWERLAAGMGRISNIPLYIDDKPALTLLDVRAKVRRVKKASGNRLAVVILDYLQLMEGEGENNNVKYGTISRGLKRIAKEFQVAVVLLSQLSRDVERRPNKRPIMADLRDSGAIEADADIIIFVYRDEVYNPDSQDKGSAEIIIGKNRNGPLVTVRTVFTGEYVRFDNWSAPGSY